MQANNSVMRCVGYRFDKTTSQIRISYKFLIYAIHSDNDFNTYLAFFENSENSYSIILKKSFSILSFIKRFPF